jgi:hypothetical protein
MSTILIYRHEGKKLELKGKWVDGEFVYDEGGFSDIDYIEEYTEDMIMERFSGMYYYAVYERNTPPDQLEGEININMVKDMTTDSLESRDNFRLEKVKQYKNGELDKEDYTEQNWRIILEYVDELGDQVE